MTNEKKANFILKKVNESYTIPTYMEKYVIKGIIEALTFIEHQEEGKENHYGR